MSQQADTVPQTQEGHAGPERRAYVRFIRLRDARVRTGNEPTSVFGIAVIRDVSANGLSLFLNSRVKEGTILRVEPQGIKFPRSLLARVVRVRPQANGWGYGCELANSLSDEELQLLRW